MANCVLILFGVSFDLRGPSGKVLRTFRISIYDAFLE